MIFSVYSVKMVFLFPTNITLLSKKQRWSSAEKYLSGVIEKDDIHPRKYDISSDRKIKDDKKV